MAYGGNTRPVYWQWPNVLGIDAAGIAVLWQIVFRYAAGDSFAWPEASVLGLSVWLTYAADRLFDVRRRRPDQLLSLRHQFAKRRSSQLWKVWFGILALDLGIALTVLPPAYLLRGCVLLLVCLAYTWLHRQFAERFFPKELFVAGIYTGGVLLFVPAPVPAQGAVALALLCLLNCLIISHREREHDDALGVRSLNFHTGSATRIGLALGFCFLLPGLPAALGVPLGISGVALFFVTLPPFTRSAESFRILADGTLLLGPLCSLLASAA